MRPLPAPGVLLALVVSAGCTPAKDGDSAAAPTARITSPAGGTAVEVGSTVTLVGDASDADDAPGSLDARWLVGGAEVCAAPPDAEGTTACALVVPDAPSLDVRLEVTDRSGAVGADAITLTVTSDTTPTVTLSSPEADAVYAAGELLTFAGAVSDAEDAPSDLATWWEADGAVLDTVDATPDSSGEVIGYGALDAGQHVIALHATDTDGNVASATVLVTVEVVNTPPSCTILAPEDGGSGVVGTLVAFYGEVADVDEPADVLTVEWSSDQDGVLDTHPADTDGGVACSTSALSAGPHRITLRITDTAGETCTDSIGWTVESPPTLTLDAPTTGEVVMQGEPVLFSAIVADAEDTLGDLVVRWESSLDGVIQEGPPDSSGLVTFEDDGLSVGDHALLVTVTDTDGLYATAAATFTVEANPDLRCVDPDPATLEPEIPYDGIDNDCDEATPDDDLDGDGYPAASDCDDADATAHPGAADTLADGTDQDCDGVDGPDADGDGFADAAAGGEDCDDSDPAVNPGASDELGSDRNCDGVVSVQTLADASFKLVGDDPADGAGYSVSTAGDVDGDGLDDVLVGAWGDRDGGGYAGAAYVVLGSSLGSSRTIDLSAADYKLVGEDADDCAGASVSTAGDVDGDGLADLLVGAAYDEEGGDYAGSAYVVLGSSLGSSRTIDLSAADFKLVGQDPGDVAGWSVSSAGDVDGDGLADLLVGARGRGDGGRAAGAAYVVLGSSLGSSRTIDLSAADYELVGEDADDLAGQSVSSAGDVDGDGLGDLLVGAPSVDGAGDYAGAAYVVLGSSLGASRTIDLSAADYKLVGEDAKDQAGWSVSSAGDVDGDGLADLLVGARGHRNVGPSAGSAYVVLGASLGSPRAIDLSAADYRLVGERSRDSAGVSVSTAGDVDGDGLDDLVVGADGDDDGGSHAGAAYLVLGSSLGSSRTLDLSRAEHKLVGEDENAHAGLSVSSAGDVDGDGLADLLVGARGDHEGGAAAGAAYVLLAGGGAGRDADGDGHGLEDCDDSDPATHPGAADALADGIDQDCDGIDGPDLDGDGFADAAAGGDDCDDGSAAISPSGQEMCNGVDDDCDALVDEDISPDAPSWYLDGDGDTFGDAAVALRACTPPGGYVDDDTDCDDSDATIHPGADDAATDATDQNCDGLDGPDVDEDGYVDAAAGGDDCDDGDAAENPAALWYADGDGDTYGDPASSSVCARNAATDVLNAEDCDDGDPDVNPAASDRLTSDRNCDGVVSGGDLANASFKFVGEDSPDAAGFSVSSAGDVDGDGLADLLVGAVYDDDGGSFAGAVYLLLGSSLGPSRTIDLSAADYKLVGEDPDDGAGHSVSSAGDVDGDGLSDLLVGAFGDDDGGSDAGAAYLVLGSSLGSSRTVDLSSADYKFVGEDSGDLAGDSVSSAGDVDGDGLGDLLVGAFGDDDGGADAGAAYLVLGASLGSSRTIDLSAADEKLVGEDSADYAGGSVSSAGDVDGDGLDDLLIGAGGDSTTRLRAVGAAYVVLGSSVGSTRILDLSAADYKLVGEETADEAGGSVSSAGDVDGDGLDDLLVGAGGDDDGGRDAGAAYVVLGSSLGASRLLHLSAAAYKLVGEDTGDSVGSDGLSSAGDVDGDGLDDLLVGASRHDNGLSTESGAMYLVLGSSLASSPTIDLSGADDKLLGEASADYGGLSVAGAGDVDGDGLDDALVGAWGNDEGGDRAGAAYLLLGG